MADEKAAGGEPSMEEILASIRQIINQNEKPAEGPADTASVTAANPMSVAMPTAPSAAAVDNAPEDDEVLVLTDILSEAPAPAFTPTPVVTPEEVFAPDVAPQPAPAPPAAAMAAPVAPVSASTNELISNTSAAAATAALSTLANTLQQERNEHSLPLGNGMRTLESMAVEALKPLLKEWLDANLPAIVERIVQQEVEKLTKRLGA